MGVKVDIRSSIKTKAVLINTKENKQIEIYWNKDKINFEHQIINDIEDATGAGDILVSSFVNNIYGKVINKKAIIEAMNQALITVEKSLKNKGALGFLKDSYWEDDKIQF
ncbi:hypothetical protein SCLARK_001054 [Spiroplasma clarkii]|uniref:hypothetical protein n=1 Tax=Spiroplasma clarkii TaxID=2139 RepID=UPI000B581207|nr:hypothetical protein [Spiroplasma clarkii]ARU91634.1 hypothetical protein SCLARK_001054 [Spiroplasma clarkii]